MTCDDGPVPAEERALGEGRPDALGELRAARRRRCPGSRSTNSSPPQRPARSDSRSVAAEDGGELAQDVVADGVAVHVVDGLEVVEVGEDERERRAEPARRARSPRESASSQPAPVRDAGEPVDERLPLDDPVQPRVLERDRRVRRERRRGQPLLLVEDVADEVERPERRPADRERKLEPLAVGVRIAGLDDVAAVGAEPRRRRRRSPRPQSRRSTRRSCSTSCVAASASPKRVDRVAQAAALGLELGEPRLELVRHVVERGAEQRELVAAPHRHALGEPAARDRACAASASPRSVRTIERPSKYATSATSDERREQPEQQAVARGRVGGVDQRLRA